MDPVTHALLGATLGQAGFHRRLGGRVAALAGGLSALAPDVDVFIRSSSDPLLAIEHHRGFTHALLLAPAGAAMVAALWLLSPAWRAGFRWAGLWPACLLGYVSHTLLDAATSYGTQLLWPFSRQRFGWDVISIIDPIFTIALIAGLGCSLLRRTRWPAGIALSFAAAYLSLGSVQHARAVAAQRQLAASRGHEPQRYEVMPTLANNIVWRAIYVHGGRIWSDRVRVGWFSRPAVREGWSLPLVGPEDLLPVEQARNRRRAFERFAWFTEHWVARSPADPTVLGDMRYSLSTEAFDPIWGIRFVGGGTPAGVEWVNRTRNRRIDPGELWREIAGEDPRFQPARVARSRNHHDLLRK